MKKILSLNEGWIFCKEGVKETVNLPHTWNGLDGQGAGDDGYFRGACTYTRILPKYSGKVYQTHINRTIVEEHISKVSLPNWIHKVDKFITYFNATANKVTNVVKSFFGNFQYASLIPW